MAFLGLTPKLKAGAGSRDCEPRRVGSYPIPRRLRLTACVPRLGRETRAGRVGRARGRDYRGSRHDDASPHKWGCA
jgi:hypothetical protein